MLLCLAPLETRLLFVLYGVKSDSDGTEGGELTRYRLATASLPLFDSASYLKQVSKNVALNSGKSFHRRQQRRIDKHERFAKSVIEFEIRQRITEESSNRFAEELQIDCTI